MNNTVKSSEGNVIGLIIFIMRGNQKFFYVDNDLNVLNT